MKKDAAVSYPVKPAPQYPIESVDNALKILLLLGDHAELRLTEVSQYLGVATSTAHRLLAMLLYRGFVRQDPTSKTYVAGNTLTGIAAAIQQRFDLRVTVRRYLQKLNTDLRETVHLGVLDGNVVRFVDALESPRAVRVASRLGRTMPAHCTSTGKAMLARLEETDLRRLYPRGRLTGLTTKSIRSRATLERELDTIRRRGFATSTEESEEGVSSVAVALGRESSNTLAALNVSVPSNRMGHTQCQRIVQALRSVVAEAEPLLHC